MTDLFDDIEDCEELYEDRYYGLTTTAARARLCGQCAHYTIENIHMPSVRCKLDLRPTAEFDKSIGKWKATCSNFIKRV
ncbi:MAG: hypothetical protein QNJ31_05710 [Candidatus Caenarcaniphilales bacterium]|nr:hypothetical protein [Candidatus Caenarcaniphilales bacterium]